MKKPTKTLHYKKLPEINTGNETKAVLIGALITFAIMAVAAYGILSIIKGLGL